ncbi:MAG: NAD(P)-dependent oxidoreductase [Candidatus Omnitrophica bacterium]|nr:NAD(P)-dependent oxidoreductase [Candidatus Omnitrophota bacterium]
MKISILGTGLLGSALAQRLLFAGNEVCVYNRTSAKAKALVKDGAIVAESVQEAINQSECTILMLADIDAINNVLFKKDIKSFYGKTIIQMGTISPAQSVQLNQALKELEGDYFECPVLGSRKEAISGNLILMAGSTPEQFNKWLNLLKMLGPNPQHIGGVGKAAAMKLALNHLIAAHAVAFSVSLGLIEKNGIDQDVFMGILRESALYASMYDKKLQNWKNREYANPNFPVKHLLKDVELVLHETQEKQINSEEVKALSHILQEAINHQLGD